MVEMVAIIRATGCGIMTTQIRNQGGIIHQIAIADLADGQHTGADPAPQCALADGQTIGMGSLHGLPDGKDVVGLLSEHLELPLYLAVHSHFIEKLLYNLL